MPDLSWNRLLDLNLTAAEAARLRGVTENAAYTAAQRRGRRWRRPPVESPARRASLAKATAASAAANGRAVVIGPVTYPSIAAAARALHLPDSTVRAAVGRGTVEDLLGGIVILGTRFRTARAAARCYGVSDTHVRMTARKGQAALDAAARRWRAKQLRRPKVPPAIRRVEIAADVPVASASAVRSMSVSLTAAPWEVAA